MNTLTISPRGRIYLPADTAMNGTFVHTLYDPQGNVGCIAKVIIEQCDKAISVRVEIGDSRNSITLRRGDDAGERIARFVEEIANGVTPSSVPEVDEHELISDEEVMLRDAIRLGRGTYWLAMEDELDLCLCLRPGMLVPSRALFRFELNGTPLTLWLRVPGDRQVAYELLSGCVEDLLANYRSGAAA